ncbi:MAG: glycoside hydrolase family 26 protein [Lachnospiraceae bacterium]|nr:glycoside hydrolase family 26 protein [Lachnospiraceae bacterium]
MNKRILLFILLGMASFMLNACTMKNNDTPAVDITETADATILEADLNDPDPTAQAVSVPVRERLKRPVRDYTIGITAHWGWIAVMSLKVSGESELDADFYEIPATLVNPNADDNALGLMSFLVMQYGLKFLSGQQSQGNWRSDHGLFGGESQFIYEQTGKRPAVIGLDFINYSASAVAKGIFTAETEAAIPQLFTKN